MKYGDFLNIKESFFFKYKKNLVLIFPYIYESKK